MRWKVVVCWIQLPWLGKSSVRLENNFFHQPQKLKNIWKYRKAVIAHLSGTWKEVQREGREGSGMFPNNRSGTLGARPWTPAGLCPQPPPVEGFPSPGLVGGRRQFCGQRVPVSCFWLCRVFGKQEEYKSDSLPSSDAAPGPSTQVVTRAVRPRLRLPHPASHFSPLGHSLLIQMTSQLTEPLCLVILVSDFLTPVFKLYFHFCPVVHLYEVLTRNGRTLSCLYGKLLSFKVILLFKRVQWWSRGSDTKPSLCLWIPGNYLVRSKEPFHSVSRNENEALDVPLYGLLTRENLNFLNSYLTELICIHLMKVSTF